ncbi:hypothetical protein DSM107007_24440 [Nostoc sp. PCC 7120 = FACHB-418]|nr:hypothetical protein DSM107007_24440 [Nostoc sp. PCC 7120 = FACHB-418]
MIEVIQKSQFVWGVNMASIRTTTFSCQGANIKLTIKQATVDKLVNSAMSSVEFLNK